MTAGSRRRWPRLGRRSPWRVAPSDLAHRSWPTLMVTVADIQFSRGELDAAIAMIREVIELQRELLGPDHPELDHAHGNLGLVLGEAGRPEDSLEEASRAIEILERALGPEHPEVGRYTDVVATALQDLRRHDEARRASATRRATDCRTRSRITSRSGAPRTRWCRRSAGY